MNKIVAVLLDDEIMTGLYRAGFITAKVFEHRDIYFWVSAQVKTRNISKNQAIMEATEKFGKCERTIKYAMKAFKQINIVQNELHKQI